MGAIHTTEKVSITTPRKSDNHGVHRGAQGKPEPAFLPMPIRSTSKQSFGVINLCNLTSAISIINNSFVVQLLQERDHVGADFSWLREDVLRLQFLDDVGQGALPVA